MRMTSTSTQRVLFNKVSEVSGVGDGSFSEEGKGEGYRPLLKKKKGGAAHLAILILNMHLGLEKLVKERKGHFYSNFNDKVQGVIIYYRKVIVFVEKQFNKLEVSLKKIDLKKDKKKITFKLTVHFRIKRWIVQCLEIENALLNLGIVLKELLDEKALKAFVYSSKKLLKKEFKERGESDFDEFLKELSSFKKRFKSKSSSMLEMIYYLHLQLKEILKKECWVTAQIYKKDLLGEHEFSFSSKDLSKEVERSESDLHGVMKRCQGLSQKGMNYLQKLVDSTESLSLQKRTSIESFLKEFSEEMNVLRLGIIDLEKLQKNLDQGSKKKNDLKKVLAQSLTLLTTMDQLSPVLKERISLGSTFSSLNEVFRKTRKNKI